MGTGVKFGFVGEGLVAAERGGPRGSGGAGQGSGSRTPAPNLCLLKPAQPSWAGGKLPPKCSGGAFPPFFCPTATPGNLPHTPPAAGEGRKGMCWSRRAAAEQTLEAKTNEQ